MAERVWIDDRENPFVDHDASANTTTSMGAVPPTDRLFAYSEVPEQSYAPELQEEYQGYWSRVFYSIGVTLALLIVFFVLGVLFFTGLFVVPIVFGLFRKGMWK